MSVSFVSKYIHTTTNNMKVIVVETQQIFSARLKCFDLNCFRSRFVSISMVVGLTLMGYCSYSLASFTKSSIATLIFKKKLCERRDEFGHQQIMFCYKYIKPPNLHINYSFRTILYNWNTLYLALASIFKSHFQLNLSVI